MINRIKINNEDHGIRLDRWFKRHYPQAHFIQIAKASRKGNIRINGKQSDISTQLHEGQEISFPKRIVERSDFTSFTKPGSFKKRDNERLGKEPESRFKKNDSNQEGGNIKYPRSKDTERSYYGQNQDKKDFRKKREHEGKITSSRNSLKDNRERDNREKSNKNYTSGRHQFLANQLINSLLYKDDNLLVINKPAGISTQGGTGISISIDDLLDYMKFGSERRPRLVHRLDKDTSGILVLARRFDSAAKFSQILREKQVHKKYFAIWCGVPAQQEGVIDQPLYRSEDHSNGKMLSDDLQGKEAITHYKVISYNDFFSLVELVIITGRTHQIRAHSSIIGCPILGDYKYSKAPTKHSATQAIYSKAHRDAKFMHLHAREIEFKLDGKNIQVSAPVPKYFEQTMIQYKLQQNN